MRYVMLTYSFERLCERARRHAERKRERIVLRTGAEFNPLYVEVRFGVCVCVCVCGWKRERGS